MKQYTIEEIRTHLAEQADNVNVYKWLDYAAGFKFVIDQLVELENSDSATKVDILVDL